MTAAHNINMKIPGKVAWDELMFLGKLAAQVPKGGKIVEIGPLYGRSTFTLGSSAPHAEVFAIDTFEDAPWVQKYAAQSSKIPTYGLDAFKSFTSSLPNIKPIQGYSPQIVSDWSAPIDMYFEDATHGNPNLKENMDFWIGHLKPGGIVCGHDYTLRFPDVKSEAEKWGEKWGTRPVIVGSLWAIQKPKAEGGASDILSLPFDENDEHKTLKIYTQNKLLGRTKNLSGYWAGSHLNHDALNKIAINFETPSDDLQIEYRLGHPETGRTKWIAGGQFAKLVKGKKFGSVAKFS